MNEKSLGRGFLLTMLIGAVCLIFSLTIIGSFLIIAGLSIQALCLSAKRAAAKRVSSIQQTENERAYQHLM